MCFTISFIWVYFGYVGYHQFYLGLFWLCGLPSVVFGFVLVMWVTISFIWVYFGYVRYHQFYLAQRHEDVWGNGGMAS
jgi:hypothetical protein